MTDLDLSKYDGHTPGPWQIGYDDGSGPENIVATDGGKTAAFARLRWGCSCCEPRVEDYPLKPVEQANARLIADAPLLLAEVRRLREDLKVQREMHAVCLEIHTESESCLAAEEELERLREERAEWWRDEVAALRQSNARLLKEMYLQRERWVLLKQVPDDPADQAVCAIRNLDAAVAEAEALNG